ncbi:MAG: 3-phosphoserine/phosphohydroxythreonine transaminase, partial [Ardenticatenaceae bacterium]
LEGMDKRNQQKANLLYRTIDESGGFYQGYAEPDSRSLMNVTFNLPTKELEQQFVAEAAQESMIALKGYRTMGGIRASIYNATDIAACEALSSFMGEFMRRHG